MDNSEEVRKHLHIVIDSMFADGMVMQSIDFSTPIDLAKGINAAHDAVERCPTGRRTVDIHAEFIDEAAEKRYLEWLGGQKTRTLA